jgi:hypothetical protein
MTSGAVPCRMMTSGAVPCRMMTSGAVPCRMMPLGRCQLHEHPCSERRTLLKGATEMLRVSVGTFFIPTATKFGTWDVHKNRFAFTSFVKFYPVKATLCLRV